MEMIGHLLPQTLFLTLDAEANVMREQGLKTLCLELRYYKVSHAQNNLLTFAL